MAASSRQGSGRAGRGAYHTAPPTEQESVFWSSLQLLGFGEGNSAAGVPELGPTMFRRVNGSGMDCVLHFLFALLRGDDALRRELRGCWPPQDGKQRTEWKKAVRGYLEQLAQEGAIPSKLVASASSLLHTASGPRLVELFLYLSHHALRVVHQNTFPQDAAALPLVLEPSLELTPVELEALAEPILNVASSRVALARDAYLDVARKASAEHRSWHTAADKLTAEYRRLLAQDASLQQELTALRGTTMGISESAQAEEAKEAERLWDELRDILGSCNGLAEASGVIVYGEAHPHAISGRELLSLSNNSLIHSVSEPRLDVAALLEAWTGRVSDLQASLASLSRRGQNGSRSQPAAWSEPDTGHMLHLKSTLKAHKESRNALLDLKGGLEGDVNSISKSIQQLQAEVDSLFVRISGSTPSPSPGETAPLPELSPLRLVPPTPAAVRAGPVLTVHTPTPSVWTSDASQADESVLSVCRQSSRRGRAVSDFTPESTLRRPSTPLGQPGTQRIPEMGIHSTPQRVGHAECPRSCPPPDTIERQFTAGLALDEDDDYSLLEDFQMPLQGVCCNLASDVTSPAVQVPKEKGKSSEPATPPSPGVFWDENGSPCVA